MQKLLGQMRCAVDRYHMIAEGDRIAIGISGREGQRRPGSQA